MQIDLQMMQSSSIIIIIINNKNVGMHVDRMYD